MNLRTRTDQIDYDYLNKLTPKQLEFLNRFTEEWIHASIDSEDLTNNLYARSQKKKKEVYDKNNARNRCVLTKQKAAGQIKYIEELLNFPSNDPLARLEAKMDLKATLGIDLDNLDPENEEHQEIIAILEEK